MSFDVERQPSGAPQAEQIFSASPGAWVQVRNSGEIGPNTRKGVGPLMS
jgi:hypothetical protein